jgi:hypothetical protein
MLDIPAISYCYGTISRTKPFSSLTYLFSNDDYGDLSQLRHRYNLFIVLSTKMNLGICTLIKAYSMSSFANLIAVFFRVDSMIDYGQRYPLSRL